MHPNNIYRSRIDFKRYLPHIEKYLIDGTIDFSDLEALSCLVKAQFLVDFGLKMEFSGDSLIPRLPNRLNYMHLVDDYVAFQKFQQKESSLKVIDIGTGASCVFLVLLDQLVSNLKLTGLEPDSANFEQASKNLTTNNLSDKICLKNEKYQDHCENHDILVCNPPFFKNSEIQAGSVPEL